MAAELDRDHALFWLDAMARGMDDESILRTFVSRVVLGGPDGGDGLRIAFTFDSPFEGGDLALGASQREVGGGRILATARQVQSGASKKRRTRHCSWALCKRGEDSGHLSTG